MMLHENRPVHRLRAGHRRLEHDALADETLVSIVQADRVLTRLLASADDLLALVVGHMDLEHGCRLDRDDLALLPQPDGSVSIAIDETINIPSSVARADIVTSSCGACHHPSLAAMVAGPTAALEPAEYATMDDVADAFAMMERQQPGFDATGGLHAAMLWAPDGTHVVMEDIGRHNAVDKVWGAWRQLHIDRRPSMLLLSGRLGWDIASKATQMGASTVACRGAASTLAADMARAQGLRLVTFWKASGAVVIGPFDGPFDAKD